MSYEYLMCRPVTGISPVPAFEEIDEFDSLGTVDDVKSAIGAVFPSVQWKFFQSPIGVAWFGRMGPPEFQITVGSDNTVTNFTMSRANSEEVLRLAKAMHLIAMDLQNESVFSG